MSETLEAKPYLVKLVRDAVATKLVTDTIDYRPIDDRTEALKLLRGKLVEEAVEYLLDPCLHELADVLEAVEALRSHDLGVSPVDLEIERKRKRESRGGFDNLTGMYAATSAGKWA